ncbi:MAG: S-methylmethionine-dependent homocysteine/selenocysteine methylase [Ilumatobacter sp.]|jgi:S-methylmethionine-dependent homocysteine/selenocysteine methylase
MTSSAPAANSTESTNEITILDGGMGKFLRRIGAPFRQPEWSALALIESPDHVVDAHTQFIDAGAQVIITNNYAVVPYHLGDDRFAAQGADLIELSGRLARQAADTAGVVLVAGSLPPLFGSYEPDLFDADRAPEIYALIVQQLDRYVDVWIAETLSLVAELDVIVAAIREHGSGQPIWASFSLPDAYDGEIALRSGDTIDDIIDVVTEHADVVDAVMFNCALPEQMTPAIIELAEKVAAFELDIQIGGYANGFPDARQPEYAANNTIFDRRPDLDAASYVDIVATWIDAGATIVGGCCDMYPEDIAALSTRFG